MPKFEVEVKVMPRAGLLDPQGAAVEHALSALDFADIAEVRVGRAISIRLERRDRETALADAREMCSRFLANPITEDYSVAVRGSS
jgi:phosphoribosylformylglycinamidine synthase